jgi:ribosomal protein S27E
MAKKKQKPISCDCIFCNAKCPDCGSTQVEIIYKPEYTLSNDMENNLDIRVTDSHVELTCEDCGAWIQDDTDGRLNVLGQALYKHIGVSEHQITIEHGKIKTAAVTWTVNEKITK